MWVRPLMRRLATAAAHDPKAAAISLMATGTKHWESDNIQAALEAFQESAQLLPTSDAYFNTANCQLTLKQYQAAIESFQRSIDLDPHRSDAHLNAANVYMLFLNDFQKAIEHYEKAIDLNPNDGQILFNYGCVLEFKGHLEKAEQLYERAVELGIERAQQNLRNVRAKQK